ncbi:MAG: hypothetical protein KAU16_01260, partial [Methanophagales archaeon]|nr:hypothetical protein [Methanophagales archaeon]
GMPHQRFHGLTGKIKGEQGRAYIVEVSDGQRKKDLFIRAEHLSPQVKSQPIANSQAAK